jgi:hypothetical protein
VAGYVSRDISKTPPAPAPVAYLRFCGAGADRLRQVRPEQRRQYGSDAAPPPLAALPLATGDAAAAAPAPAATQLPPPPAPVSYAAPVGDDYAYLDQAYALRQAIADAPPDFTYDYDGQQPMTWRADDGSECVAEQLPDGSLRYYFYQPGADEPYLVQDPDYSYGYSNGTLVVVYDADGNVVAGDAAQRQEDIAGRYLARAEALYQASVRDQHEAVAEANWERQRERVYQDQQRWVQAQDRDAAWRAYHQQQQDQEQAHWAQERYRRESEASRFAHTINDTTAIARAAQGLAAAADEARRHNQPVPAGAPPPNAASPTPPPPAAPPPPRPMAPPQASPPPSPPAHDQREQRPPQPAQAAPPPAAAAPPAPPPGREQRDQRPQRPPQPAQAAPPPAAAALAAPPAPPPGREQRDQRPQRPPQAAPPPAAAAPAAPPAPPPGREQRDQRPQRPPPPAQAAPPPAAAAPAAPPAPPSKALAAAPTPPAKPAGDDHGKKLPRDRKDAQPPP